MESIRAILAKNLQDMRKMHGMSQVDIAKKIGISSTAYGRWENGINWPDPASLEQLANEYGVRPSRFFYDPDMDKAEIQDSWINRPSPKDIKKALLAVIESLD